VSDPSNGLLEYPTGKPRPAATVTISWPDGVSVTYHQVDLEAHVMSPIVRPETPVWQAGAPDLREVDRVKSFALRIQGVLTARESDGQFLSYKHADAPGAEKSAE
jgi:hypothetical protein